ncbi:MAG: VWA domain-containing protein [Candidatus Acidiferrum sp.]
MSTRTGFAPLLPSTRKAMNLSMQKLWLTGQVLAMGARLWVRHEFASQEPGPVEVIYSFALPRDASLRRFRVSGENFQVDSELRPTREAHKLYEEGIQAGSLATMARLYGDGIVNLSVGNIRPGENVVVLLELVAGVALSDDSLRLRFPFTLAPSYHAQARVAEIAPGVSEMELPGDKFDDLILPQFAKNGDHLHQVGFCLDVQMGGAIQEIASPSHALRVQNKSAESSRVLLSRESEIPDRDLVLDVRTKPAGASLFSGVDSAGKGRFAAVIPSTQFGQLTASARRFVILLDRSGSMQGTPIAQAKKAIEACLGALDEQDFFGLVAFSNSSEVFQPELSKGTLENRRDVQKFLESINAAGGTELASGAEAAARLLKNEPGDMLVITDGQVFGTEEILQRARATGVRIHCLGIGSASQDRFLSQLASQTGGVSRFLTPNERVDLPAIELFASIGRPVAKNITAEIVGAGEGRILPQPSHYAFSGTPLLVSGEANPAADTSAYLKVSWLGPQAEAHLELPIPLAASPLGDTLKLLQGARIISDYESRILPAGRVGVAARREGSRANEQLLQLSREYALASSEMALVAVVKRTGDVAGEIPKTMIVPVGLPAGMVEDLLSPPPLAMAATRPLGTGSYAVTAPPGGAYPTTPDTTTASSPSSIIGRLFRRKAVPQKRLKRHEPPSQSTDDVLVALAGMLEPDGGLPGKTAELRIANSLAALCCFVSQGSTSGSGPFRVHVAKLLKFLSPEQLKRLNATIAQDVARLSEKIAAGKSPNGDWLPHARKLAESKPLDLEAFWHQLTEAAHAA